MKNTLQLISVIMLILTSCAKATPAASTLPPSITTVSFTDTPPAPQSTEAIIPTQTLEIEPTMKNEKDGATLLYVPGGQFLMGSNDYQTNYDAPQHSVTLDAFWIDQTEVTNKQYAMCVSDGECTPPSSTKSPTRSSYYGNPEFDDYPVIYVDWDQANTYCAWAGLALPTEAQWEKAARGTDGRIYPWGNTEPSSDLLNYNSKLGDTTKVGSYELGKSFYSAYDMAGNVWEWTNDWYDENYYQKSPSLNPLGPKNPSGSVIQSNYARVLRGGSWFFEEGSLRSIFRYGVVPVEFLVRSDTRSWAIPKYEDTSVYGRPPFGFGTVGIRCAMSLP